MSKKALLGTIFLIGVVNCSGLERWLVENEQKRSSIVDKGLSAISDQNIKTKIKNGLNLSFGGLENALKGGFSAGLERIEEIFGAISEKEYPKKAEKKASVEQNYRSNVLSLGDKIFEVQGKCMADLGEFLNLFRDNQLIKLMEMEKKAALTKKAGPADIKKANMQNMSYKKKIKILNDKLSKTNLNVGDVLNKWKSLPVGYKNAASKLEVGLASTKEGFNDLLKYVRKEKEKLKPSITIWKDIVSFLRSRKEKLSQEYLSLQLDIHVGTAEEFKLTAIDKLLKNVYEVLGPLWINNYVNMALTATIKALGKHAYEKSLHKIEIIEKIKSNGKDISSRLDNIKRFAAVIEDTDKKKETENFCSLSLQRANTITSQINPGLPINVIEKSLEGTEAIISDINNKLRVYSNWLRYECESTVETIETFFARIDKYRGGETLIGLIEKLNNAKKTLKDYKKILKTDTNLNDYIENIKGLRKLLQLADYIRNKSFNLAMKTLMKGANRRNRQQLARQIWAVLREAESHMVKWDNRVAGKMKKGEQIYFKGNYRRAIESLRDELAYKDMKVLKERLAKAVNLRNKLSELTPREGYVEKDFIRKDEIDKILQGK